MLEEKISPAALAKSKVLLSDLISAMGVHLDEHSNGEFSGLCPFHNEKSPSFTVNDDKGFGHCFGCGAHVDHFDWLKRRAGLDFKEALSYLQGGAVEGLEIAPLSRIDGAKRPDSSLEITVADRVPETAIKLLKGTTVLNGGGIRLQQVFDFKAGFGKTRPMTNGAKRIFDYRDHDGVLIGHVVRFEHKNDEGKIEKDTMPFTWVRVAEGEQAVEGWANKGFTREMRLPYKAELIRDRDEAVKLWLEGEKAVDAAEVLLGGPNWLPLGWMGGVRSVDKFSISPEDAAGRHILCPDNDVPGEKAMATLRARLIEAGAREEDILVSRAPSGSEKGWDIADAKGWKREDAVAWLDQAVPCDFPEETEDDELAAQVPGSTGADDGFPSLEPVTHTASQSLDPSPAAQTPEPLRAFRPATEWDLDFDPLPIVRRDRTILDRVPESIRRIISDMLDADWRDLVSDPVLLKAARTVQKEHWADWSANRTQIAAALGMHIGWIEHQAALVAYCPDATPRSLLLFGRIFEQRNDLWADNTFLDAMIDLRAEAPTIFEKLCKGTGASKKKMGQGDIDSHLAGRVEVRAALGQEQAEFQHAPGDEEFGFGEVGGGSRGGHGHDADDAGGDDTGFFEMLRENGFPLRCLGIDNDGVCYYLTGIRQVILVLPRQRHTRFDLWEIAPKYLWATMFPHAKTEGEGDWGAAIDWLIAQSIKAGQFNARFIRGRGAWMDDGRTVVHLGDRLVINGEEVALSHYEGRYVYGRSYDLPAPNFDNPLSAAEGHAILKEVMERVRWERGDLDAAVGLGWIGASMISGALPWRPHAWITGAAGTGKTWLQEHVFSPLLEGLVTHVQGSTTEAGLRQELKADALPVLFDEAEAEDDKGQRRIQAILELARQASAESGARVLKGTVGGSALSFQCRSTFLLSSIGVNLRMQADMSRFTVLSISPPATGKVESEQAKENFKLIKASTRRLITKDTGRRMFARMLTSIPRLEETREVIDDELGAFLGSQRVTDQMGALLACAWVLTHDEALSGERLFDWLGGAAEALLAIADETTQENDATRLLRLLNAGEVLIDGGNTRQTLRVGMIIGIASGRRGLEHDIIDPDRANSVLRPLGLLVTGGRLMVANQSPAIAGMLKESPWAVNWNNVLKRIPGAKACENSRFSAGLSSRSWSIPLDYVL